jgi:two-component system sensor histidine kinase/response regulator
MSNSQPAIADNARILVIDDQEDNLALLDAVLSSKGFNVETVDNGADGLEAAWASAPDLVLLDLAMPVMDGFQVLEHLRSDRRTQRTPVIVLTANYRDADMVERGLALGATEYLTKPLQMEELVVRIRSALRLAVTERELARLRRDFASMLVHDMRAPLDGIKLVLGTLIRQEEEGSRKRVIIDQARAALVTVSHLMDDLLHTNRLEEEGFTPKTQQVSLATLIDDSLTTLDPVARARGLELTAEGFADTPRVAADPGLLRRVIDNLVSNALKFTDTGSVRLCAQTEGAFVRISVTDTGAGMPQDVCDRVFDRYFHIERRRENRQSGFGLGLAFCQRAVDAMGGQIGVSSKEGAGSTFWFTLPAV